MFIFFNYRLANSTNSHDWYELNNILASNPMKSTSNTFGYFETKQTIANG